ncbi:MAG: bacterioferritin [Salaquimonas sp.]|nr:bacterioferritin [Salaquimonas sp.]
MKGNEKVIERLNHALFLELGAVSQYWLHYRLLDDWGYALLARKEREESIEEMNHADRLVERIIFLEGHPNLQSVAPLRIGQDVKEVLDADLAGEHEARTAYKEARDVCHDAGDYVSMKLFEELLIDEEGHIDFLETQLELYENIGPEKYGQLNATPANDAE